MMNDLDSNQASVCDYKEARVSNESVNDSNSKGFDRVRTEIDEIRVFPGLERDGGDSRVLDGSQCREIGDFADSGHNVSSEKGKSSEIDEIRVFPGSERDGGDSRVLDGSEYPEIGEFSDSGNKVSLEKGKSSKIDEIRVLSGSEREGSDSGALDGTQGHEIRVFVDSKAEVMAENGKSSEVRETSVLDGGFVNSRDEIPSENGNKSSKIDETRVSQGLEQVEDDSVDLSAEISLKNGLGNDGGVESIEIGKTRVFMGLGNDGGVASIEIGKATVFTGLGNDGGVDPTEVGKTRVFTGSGREEGDSRVLDGTSNSSKNGLDGSTEIGKTRVFTGSGREEGDSRVLDGTSNSSKNGFDGDVGFESSDAPNEVVTPKAGIVTNTEDGPIEGSNTTRGGKHMPTTKNRKPQMDGTVGEFKLERRSDIGAYDVDISGAKSMKVLDTAFEMGDMVWGKVKSHPWWPGHIYHEAFATTSVRRTRREGHVLVAFFGDSSYGWFHPLDLIPYDPNFTEKSQQTNSRNFMNAVEDSIDEASKRSALGLSCRCRNSNNFRPTNVPGYLAVDVVDYDPDAVYSVSQICRARESFRPAMTLSFIRQLALAPKEDDKKSLDFIKQKATALAYRRSIFEEFDETYAQAFGNESVRKLPQLSTDKGTFRAPLSGPLVMADAVGDRKSSSKATKPKDKSKRDKYLVTTNGAPVRTIAHHMTTEDAPSGINETIGTDVSSSLQQSEPSMRTASEPTNVHHKTRDNDIRTIVSDDSGSVKKKKKVPKRSSDELKSEKSENITEKRKKKIRKTDPERSTEYLERPTPSCGGTQTTSASSKVDSISNSVRDLPKMLSDLHGLALNPLHTSERNKPVIVRKLFLKFRSLVFQKASTTAEPEPDPDNAHAEKHAIENSKTASISKSSKLSSRRPEDPTKGGKKRPPSERQEEISVKRLKKMEEVKSLSAEKRALLKINAKVSTSQQPPMSKSMNPEPQRTKLADRGRRVEEPTFLMMKFQSGSSLPSLVELKARFARFGPLDTSLSRVFYKTNTCRVAFLYKQDAHVAYRYAMGNKSVFSNVKFMLKPVAPPPEPTAPEPHHAGSATPQLKSCLKKPSGGDEPLVGPTNGSGAVRAPRVRFNMDEDKDGGLSNREGLKMPPPMESPNAVPSSEDGAPCSLPPSSSSVAINVGINQRFMPSVNHPQRNVGEPQRSDFSFHPNPTIELPGLAPPPPPSMDISQQMMNLLTRCHDVVNSVNDILGYVPYHPL